MDVNKIVAYSVLSVKLFWKALCAEGVVWLESRWFGSIQVGEKQSQKYPRFLDNHNPTQPSLTQLFTAFLHITKAVGKGNN